MKKTIRAGIICPAMTPVAPLIPRSMEFSSRCGVRCATCRRHLSLQTRRRRLYRAVQLLRRGVCSHTTTHNQRPCCVLAAWRNVTHAPPERL
ncbi:MAG: hypothetical protein ACKV2V_03550 [Blastocatellia bacterium]